MGFKLRVYFQPYKKGSQHHLQYKTLQFHPLQPPSCGAAVKYYIWLLHEQLSSFSTLTLLLGTAFVSKIRLLRYSWSRPTAWSLAWLGWSSPDQWLWLDILIKPYTSLSTKDSSGTHWTWLKFVFVIGPLLV